MDQQSEKPRDSIGELVSEYQPVLTRLARSRGVDETEVEGAVLAAWRAALSTYRPESPDFRGILFSEVLKGAEALERARPISPEDAVEPQRFEPEGSRWANWFVTAPASFAPLTVDAEEAAQARATADRVLAELPLPQRTVVVLRDVAGCSSTETCRLLGIDPTTERLLLHGGRTRVRAALEHLVEGDVPAGD